MPLEVVYVDTNAYLNTTQDFSVNIGNFPNFKEIRNTLDSGNQKLVLMMSPGIIASPDNKYYTSGNSQSVFIASTSQPESSQYGKNLISRVFGEEGVKVFVDWFNGYAATFIQDGLTDLYTNYVNFDGVWLEANELTTAVTGELPKTAQTSLFE